MICSPPFTAANKSTGMPEVARAAEPYPYRSRIAASAAAVAVSRSPSMDGHHAVLEVPFDEHRRRDTQPEHDHLPRRELGPPRACRGAAQFLAGLDGGAIQPEVALAPVGAPPPTRPPQAQAAADV